MTARIVRQNESKLKQTEKFKKLNFKEGLFKQYYEATFKNEFLGGIFTNNKLRTSNWKPTDKMTREDVLAKLKPEEVWAYVKDNKNSRSNVAYSAMLKQVSVFEQACDLGNDEVNLTSMKNIRLEDMEKAIDCGADLNKEYTNGNSLKIALESGRLDIVNLILKSKNFDLNLLPFEKLDTLLNMLIEFKTIEVEETQVKFNLIDKIKFRKTEIEKNDVKSISSLLFDKRVKLDKIEIALTRNYSFGSLSPNDFLKLLNLISVDLKEKDIEKLNEISEKLIANYLLNKKFEKDELINILLSLNDPNKFQMPENIRDNYGSNLIEKYLSLDNAIYNLTYLHLISSKMFKNNPLQKKEFQIFEEMIQKNFVNYQNSNGDTILTSLIKVYLDEHKKEYEKQIEFFINQNSNIFTTNNAGECPFSLLLNSNNKSLLKLALENISDEKSILEYLQTPSGKLNGSKLISYLSEYNSNLFKKIIENKTLSNEIQFIIFSGLCAKLFEQENKPSNESLLIVINFIENMVKNGIDIGQTIPELELSNQQFTPLAVLVLCLLNYENVNALELNSAKEVLKNLKEKNKDNTLCKNFNPLESVFDTKPFRKDLFDLLINAGAKINSIAPGNTISPLQVAMRSDEFSVFDIIKNIDPNVSDEEGNTPLLLAARENNSKIFKHYMDKTIDIFVKNDSEESVFSIINENTKNSTEFKKILQFKLFEKNYLEKNYLEKNKTKCIEFIKTAIATKEGIDIYVLFEILSTSKQGDDIISSFIEDAIKNNNHESLSFLLNNFPEGYFASKEKGKSKIKDYLKFAIAQSGTMFDGKALSDKCQKVLSILLKSFMNQNELEKRPAFSLQDYIEVIEKNTGLDKFKEFKTVIKKSISTLFLSNMITKTQINSMQEISIFKPENELHNEFIKRQKVVDEKSTLLADVPENWLKTIHFNNKKDFEKLIGIKISENTMSFLNSVISSQSEFSVEFLKEKNSSEIIFNLFKEILDIPNEKLKEICIKILLEKIPISHERGISIGKLTSEKQKQLSQIVQTIIKQKTSDTIEIATQLNKEQGLFDLKSALESSEIKMDDFQAMIAMAQADIHLGFFEDTPEKAKTYFKGVRNGEPGTGLSRSFTIQKTAEGGFHFLIHGTPLKGVNKGTRGGFKDVKTDAFYCLYDPTSTTPLQYATAVEAGGILDISNRTQDKYSNQYEKHLKTQKIKGILLADGYTKITKGNRVTYFQLNKGNNINSVKNMDAKTQNKLFIDSYKKILDAGGISYDYKSGNLLLTPDGKALNRIDDTTKLFTYCNSYENYKASQNSEGKNLNAIQLTLFNHVITMIDIKFGRDISDFFWHGSFVDDHSNPLSQKVMDEMMAVRFNSIVNILENKIKSFSDSEKDQKNSAIILLNAFKESFANTLKPEDYYENFLMKLPQ